MDELVSLGVKKIGLSEDVARRAVSTVIDFLKKKFPAPTVGQIDLVLVNSGGKAGVSKSLSNLIGKK